MNREWTAILMTYGVAIMGAVCGPLALDQGWSAGMWATVLGLAGLLVSIAGGVVSIYRKHAGGMVWSGAGAIASLMGLVGATADDWATFWTGAQGVGTLAAVVVALYIGVWEARRERHAADRERDEHARREIKERKRQLSMVIARGEIPPDPDGVVGLQSGGMTARIVNGSNMTIRGIVVRHQDLVHDENEVPQQVFRRWHIDILAPGEVVERNYYADVIDECLLKFWFRDDDERMWMRNELGLLSPI